MCGIAGYVRYGDAKVPNTVVAETLKVLEARGRDASGVAWFMKWGDDTGHYKHNVCGSELWSTRALKDPVLAECWEQLNNAQGVLLHCRARSQGSERNMLNNHPVFREGGKYLVVHNGSVRNDDAYIAKYGARQMEVDTEALALALDLGGTPEKSVTNLAMLRGSFTFAAMPRVSVDHMIFHRNSNPFRWFYEPNVKILAFASDEATLAVLWRGMGGKLKVYDDFGFGQTVGLRIQELKDDQYMIVGPEGLVLAGEQKIDYENAPAASKGKGGWRGYYHPLAGTGTRGDNNTSTSPDGQDEYSSDTHYPAYPTDMCSGTRSVRLQDAKGLIRS